MRPSPPPPSSSTPTLLPAHCSTLSPSLCLSNGPGRLPPRALASTIPSTYKSFLGLCHFSCPHFMFQHKCSHHTGLFFPLRSLFLHFALFFFITLTTTYSRQQMALKDVHIPNSGSCEDVTVWFGYPPKAPVFIQAYSKGNDCIVRAVT